MVKRGKPPFLECSSIGDKNFSAFYARPHSLNGASIEEAYQAMKIFANGQTGLSWREAKGKKAENQVECATAYEQWWREWVDQMQLMQVLRNAPGLSDRFGQEGHVCQADVLWKIRGGNSF